MTRTASARMVHDLLDSAAASAPGQTAIVSDEGSLTYAELADQSRSLATAFADLGVGRGDRVVILLPNGIPVITCLVAASRIGALFSIVNSSIKAYHLDHILSDAEPRLVVTTPEQADALATEAGPCVLAIGSTAWQAALRAAPSMRTPPGISGDPACLIYTSGSTGKPKAVISSHRNIVAAAEAISACLGMRESDVVGTFVPLSFDVGLYQFYLCCLARATLALGDDRHVGPGFIRKLIEWRVTGLPGVPSLAAVLIRLARRTPTQLPKLRFITNTGAHLPRAYIDDLRSLFPDCQVFVMYGLTECKRVSILPPAEYPNKPDSVGKPLPDTECVIVGPDGAVLPPGAVGELVVRGPHVMLGYWRAPELTAQRYRRWGVGTEVALFTGDRCSMDADGYLYFHGRSDDIYKQQGFRVSAVEVEEAATDIPGVRAAALLPPRESRGAVLFVVGEPSPEAIVQELRARLEDYKVPPRIIPIEALPLTPHGKFDKQRLHALGEEACVA